MIYLDVLDMIDDLYTLHMWDIFDVLIMFDILVMLDTEDLLDMLEYVSSFGWISWIF